MSKQKNVPESTQHEKIEIDLCFKGFLIGLKALDEKGLQEFSEAVRKLQEITWQQLWDHSSKGSQKTGLNYEQIDQTTAQGDKIHTIRVSGKHRARVIRKGKWMVFISLHPDHDSAY